MSRLVSLQLGAPALVPEWAPWAVAAAVALYAAYIAVYLLLQRRSPHATLAWLLLLAFLPGLGLFFYYLLGLRVAGRRRRRQRAQSAVTARGEQDPGVDRPEALGLPPQACALVRLIERAVGPSAALRPGRPRLLLSGAEKYAAVEEALQGARHHAHLEYYIWEPDKVGARLRDILVERARDGVAVRVLVDGFGSLNAKRRFWRPLQDAGGRVARFSPAFFRRWTPRMANFRTHRKVILVDGQVAFTGGMNVSEVHDARHAGEDAWRDTHLRLTGLACHGLQMVFLEDWYYATGEGPRGHVYFPLGEDGQPEPAAGTAGVPVQVVPSGPDEQQLRGTHGLFFSGITSSLQRVLLTSAYFVPDEPLLEALMSAAQRGVDVRVIVPKQGDVPVVAAAARSYFLDLVRAGVRVFEYPHPVLHAKSLVVDDWLAYVGSANFDNRSLRLNFEVGCAIYDPGVCAELAEAFLRDEARSHRVEGRELLRDPFRRRLMQATARLFAPLL